jgi:beta-glucosidase
VFIGYRAWEKEGRTPAYPFGHGLGYTDWTYDALEVTGTTATVRITNTGSRTGRETIQLYVTPTPPAPDRPARWLAGFANVEAAPGESVQVTVDLPARAFEIWDEESGSWTPVKGTYGIEASHSLTDTRLSTTAVI